MEGLYQNTLAETQELLDPTQLDHATKLIANARQVDIYTGSHNLYPAGMFRDRLFSAGKSATCHDNIEPQVCTALASGPDHVAIAISYSGLAPNLKDILPILSSRHVPVIVIGTPYCARIHPGFAAYLTEGRAFGPHGEDLVLANSIDRYDDALSRELTERVAHANLEMRKLGFKPYVAPALSSGALSLLALLRREWHYSSVYMDDIFMGCRNRLTPDGTIETEHLTLPPALEARLAETAAGPGESGRPERRKTPAWGG